MDIPASFCHTHFVATLLVLLVVNMMPPPKKTLETEVAMWFFISNEDSTLQVVHLSSI